MQNIFDFIDQYIKNNSNTTYGNLKDNNYNKDERIRQILSKEEYEEYEKIKMSDYQRLIKFS